MPQPLVNPNAVFLNIPYDQEFQGLYLAYITGIYQLGLIPFVASGIPGGERRLDRILVDAGTRNVYAASVFKEICFLALETARKLLAGEP